MKILSTLFGNSSGELKPWYESRTVIWNLINFILMVIALPEFTFLLTQESIPYISLVAAVGNLYLRNKTAEGVSLS